MTPPRASRHQKAYRAGFHNYCAPGYYLITITTHPNRPILSHIIDPGILILQKNQLIVPRNTPLGESVKEALLDIPQIEPRLRIKRYVIMPDHIHFVLHVTDWLPKKVGKYIAPFTTACSKAYTTLAGLYNHTTLFQPFDDTIIFNHLHLDRSMKYVADNPRRHILKQRDPHLFQRNLNLEIDGHVYAAFGNIFLLRSPHLLPVRIHRYWSPQQFEAYRTQCRYAIDHGAVPITPAIHPVEKEILQQAIADGAPAIILRDQSFGSRFKPQGQQFELCTEGRLLLLSPWPDNLSRRTNPGYTVFHTLNDHAAYLASLPAETRFSTLSDSTTKPPVLLD